MEFARKNTHRFQFIKMIFFETIRKNLAECCYYPNQTHFFGLRRIMFGCTLALSLATLIMCLCNEVDSIDEYVFLAFTITTLSGTVYSFIHTSIKTSTIFVLIDSDCGAVIQNSKLVIYWFYFFCPIIDILNSK